MKHDFLLLDDIEKGIGALYPPGDPRGQQITLNELNDAIESMKRTQNYQWMLLIGIIVLLLNKK